MSSGNYSDPSIWDICDAAEKEVKSLKVLLIGVLESQIKEKKRRAAMYARLASGEVFEEKGNEYYAERAAVLGSEIRGHNNTIKSYREAK